MGAVAHLERIFNFGCVCFMKVLWTLCHAFMLSFKFHNHIYPKVLFLSSFGYFQSLSMQYIHEGTIDVAECNQEKDLGVIFDEVLKFDMHINNAVNKANKMLGLIKRSFSSSVSDIPFLRIFFWGVLHLFVTCKQAKWQVFWYSELDFPFVNVSHCFQR